MGLLLNQYDYNTLIMKFEHKFEYEWGGEDNWYTKSKRWARNQKYPWNQICKGVIEWLWVQWVKAKVKMEMASVDKQAKEITEQWEEEDKITPVFTTEPSEVEGLDTIRVSLPFVEQSEGNQEYPHESS